MSKIRLLPARYGDSFIIECCHDNHTGVIVVDGGPSECAGEIIKAYEEYEHIDLLVLTHYDRDHIGGILEYFTEVALQSKPLKVKEVWANCAPFVKMPANKQLSTGDAIDLKNLLERFEKERGMKWMADVCEMMIFVYEFARIEIVSPTEETLGMVIEKLEKKEADLRLSGGNRQDEDLRTDLGVLAKNNKNKPNLKNSSNLANAASLAFILRSDDFSILMLGDSYPQNVECCLRRKEYSEENPLQVDYIKVSHHGSRNNISNSLLDIIDCYHYIISTNGGDGVSKHPDRETIANIVCHPKRNMEKTVHIYMNYSMDIITSNGARFINEGEEEKYNFRIHPKTEEL